MDDNLKRLVESFDHAHLFGDEYPVFCPKLEGRECNIVEVAEALVEHIRHYEVPEEEAATYWGPEFRAYYRHNYTNYDEVISYLPKCGDFHPGCNDPECNCGERAMECDGHDTAYLIIKQAASSRKGGDKS